MHKPLITACALALAASAHTAASAPQSGITPLSGYAHSGNHCYGFTAPGGWTMDNSTLAAEGVPIIFLPEGSAWKNAPMVMYTRTRNSDTAADAQAIIKKQVDETIAMYRDSEPKQTVSAAKEADFTGRDGAHGELWHYIGYAGPDVEEMAAYFPGKNTLDFFVLQLGKGADHAAGKAALHELAASYHEREHCEPCDEQTHGACRIKAE